MPPQNNSQLGQREGRIALAIHAFKLGQFKSLLAACKAYDVPYATVYKRVCGRVARHDLRPSNQKLTDTEESTLVQWILSIDLRGLSPRSTTIQQMANLLLAKRLDTNNDKKLTVGKC